MPKLHVLSFGILTACTIKQEAPPYKEQVIDYDAETATTDDNTDTNTTTESTHPLLQLASDDTALESMLWSAGDVSLQLDGNTLSGTIEYSEWWDENSNDYSCYSDLTITGTSSDTACSQLFPNHDWCYTLLFDIETQEGECIYPSEDTSFTISNPEITAFLAYSSQHQSDDGAILNDHLALGYYSDQGHSYTTLDGSSATTSSQLDCSVGEIGQHYPNLYQECGQWSNLTAQELWVSNAAVTNNLSCDGAEKADVWQLNLAAGERLKASVDTQQDGVELRLGLISPEGCLLGDVWPSAPCSNSNEECPSLVYDVLLAGEYQLFVTSDWCGDASSIAYAIDAQTL